MGIRPPLSPRPVDSMHDCSPGSWATAVLGGGRGEGSGSPLGQLPGRRSQIRMIGTTLRPCSGHRKATLYRSFVISLRDGKNSLARLFGMRHDQ